MIKRPVSGMSPVEILKARDKDRLQIFMLADGTHRAAFLNSTFLVKEMALSHETGPLETLMLGQAYTAAGLMSSTIKGEDRLNLRIDCDGPLKGLTVDVNAFGEIRGYLLANPIDQASFALNPAQIYGKGLLTVTRYLENKRAPFTGMVNLVFGNLAQDLSNYYILSEQIPTALDFGLNFDEDGTFQSAAGLILQALPGAEEKVTEELFETVKSLPNLGRSLNEAKDGGGLIKTWFSKWSPQALNSRRVEFTCHCSKEKFGSFLAVLPEDEKKDILIRGPFPLVTTCHNCNSRYEFDKLELLALFQHPEFN